MSGKRVAIVGSGIIGTSLALSLSRLGHEVTVFEKGPEYPYPHEQPFVDSSQHDYVNPAYRAAPDLARVVMSGGYTHDLGAENYMRAGGCGTAWTGLAMRINPTDFRTRSLYGFGDDWPIGYDELEPWFCAAEAHLGVSGTDADNPWAPPRSRPYPLPPFELTADDALLCGRLERAGIHMHTTPQARTSRDYDGRPACMNIGECELCPIGSRYSPNHHMQRALATGHCRLVLDAAVRRVVTDERGRARGVLVRSTRSNEEYEHAADLVIVAAAAIESARLLLLSKDARHPDGVGNQSGHVGRGLSFHHIWLGHVHYPESLHAGGVGFWTAQSAQWQDPEGRGRHGGVKVEFPSIPAMVHVREAGEATSLEESLKRFDTFVHCRMLGMHAESDPTSGKYVALAHQTDRFGDPIADVHYSSSEFDRNTHAWCSGLFERIAKASGGKEWWFRTLDDFGTYAHHMGTCRMSRDAAGGVTDSFGAVHDTPGLYLLGLSNFVGTGGAMNPTLTGVALALRAVGAIAERLG